MFNADSIKNKLMFHTIEAIRILTNRSMHAEDVLHAMQRACCTRKIVGTVQFEEWIETYIEERNGIFIVQGISLSPHILEEAFNKEFILHEVDWCFLLPHPEYLAVNDRPKSAQEWLSDGEIDFDLDKDEDWDYFLNGLNAVGY